jgi:HPt (histidine-containing phosphotransfer) domain-containing protein
LAQGLGWSFCRYFCFWNFNSEKKSFGFVVRLQFCLHESLDAVKYFTMNTQNTQPALFERATFLKRMMDDWDLCIEVLGDFLNDLPVQLEGLSQAIAQGDFLEAANRAHTIKGACASVSAEGLRDAASAMEVALKAGDLEQSKATLSSLLRTARLTDTAIRADMA